MDVTLTSDSGASKEELRMITVHGKDGGIIASIKERVDGSIYINLPEARIESMNDITLNLSLREATRDRRLPVNREVEGE